MLGCLSRIIKTIILIFAIIGFISIGGPEWIMTQYKKYNPPLTIDEIFEKSKNIIDLTQEKEKYNILKTTNILDYNVVIIEQKGSDQKLAILQTEKELILTQDDIKNNKVPEKIEKINKKLKKDYINFNNFKVTATKTLNYNNKNISYIEFEANVKNLPFSLIKGSLTAIKNKEGKNSIYISASKADDYSQDIANDFFKNGLKQN